ncbi:hypothetical protein D027_2797A, partial [Vibrio parahaemolyticus 861]
MSVYRRGNF